MYVYVYVVTHQLCRPKIYFLNIVENSYTYMQYTLGIKIFLKLVKIFLALIIFYKMNTDNDALLKF